MANFTKDNVGKGMATVFIEYKPVEQLVRTASASSASRRR
jgi:preprotein translocase subunit SecD